MRARKLLCGVGVNDSDYRTVTHETVDGKRKAVWSCPFYSRWSGMISRCYSEMELKRHPTYVGCSVSDEWLTFSNFRNWMAIQNWKGKDIDKDILVPGNKVYSAETCVFVTHMVNTFICTGRVGKFPPGVSRITKSNKFAAKVMDPITGRSEFIGCFETIDEAHKAWKSAKKEYAFELAEMQDDPRVAAALRLRYA